ncbi:MAG: MFS transporter, partial [Gemmatimonadota bacterium]
LNLIGLGLGPLCTGIVSDLLTGRFGAEALRWAMILVCLAFLPAIVCYLTAARGLHRDLVSGAS